jgi:hypothetical protein
MGTSCGVPIGVSTEAKRELNMEYGNALTGLHAVRVYTLDGIKDGEADFDGTGPVRVRTLDGTVSVQVPRKIATCKTLEGDVIYTC